jgi:cell division protein FtsB
MHAKEILQKIHLGRWLALIIGICVLTTLITSKNGFLDMYRTWAALNAAQKQLTQRHLTADSLALDNERILHDTSHIERIAREKLGMARPDEKIYKFVQEKK